MSSAAGEADSLARVVALVRESRRYGSIHEPTLRRLAAAALQVERGDVRSAAKRTKRSLHQIFGAYLPERPRYGQLLAMLDDALASRDDERVHGVLRAAMRHHTSTRERLPILGEFYRGIFSRLGPLATVLDVACGLNPLAAPWMGLAPGCRYLALDVDRELVAFVGACMERLGIDGEAQVRDVLAEGTPATGEVALLLKSLPCLERQQRDGARAVMEALTARHIVVSFPTRSIGGHGKGMRETYAAGFERIAADCGWKWERLEFPGELVYLVTKQAADREPRPPGSCRPATGPTPVAGPDPRDPGHRLGSRVECAIY